jgi:carboxypeptidase C (cathepsin A)
MCIWNLGPCRVTNATDGPAFFKESWNNNANIFFVDQPVGVGFSYAEYGQSVVCHFFHALLIYFP